MCHIPSSLSPLAPFYPGNLLHSPNTRWSLAESEAEEEEEFDGDVFDCKTSVPSVAPIPDMSDIDSEEDKENIQPLNARKMKVVIRNSPVLKKGRKRMRESEPSSEYENDSSDSDFDEEYVQMDSEELDKEREKVNLRAKQSTV